MADSQLLPQLKSGALINIQLGSAFIAKIQECFQVHVTGHEAELEILKNRNGDYGGEPLSTWENTTLMLSSLLQEIMKTAEKGGMIEYVTLDSLVKNLDTGSQE